MPTRSVTPINRINHPRLRKSTCEKVQRVAEKLGYRPNAVVSHLLAQLRASKPPRAGTRLRLDPEARNLLQV